MPFAKPIRMGDEPVRPSKRHKVKSIEIPSLNLLVSGESGGLEPLTAPQPVHPPFSLSSSPRQ